VGEPLRGLHVTTEGTSGNQNRSRPLRREKGGGPSRTRLAGESCALAREDRTRVFSIEIKGKAPKRWPRAERGGFEQERGGLQRRNSSVVRSTSSSMVEKMGGVYVAKEGGGSEKGGNSGMSHTPGRDSSAKVGGEGAQALHVELDLAV